MAHWKRILPGRILTLRLQDWVEDFDTTLGRVLDHLAVLAQQLEGVRPLPADLAKHKPSNPEGPLT